MHEVLADPFLRGQCHVFSAEYVVDLLLAGGGLEYYLEWWQIELIHYIYMCDVVRIKSYSHFG